MKVRAGPVQPAVYAHDTFSQFERFFEHQYHHTELPYTPGAAKTLHAEWPIVL